VHWRDAYSNQFNLSDEGQINFSNDFVNKIEKVDITSFIPEGEKISQFVCRTELDSGDMGMKLNLSNGEVLQLTYENPDSDVMLFPILNSVFFMIPKKSQGTLLEFTRPDKFLMNGVSIIGTQENHTYINGVELFSRKSNKQKLLEDKQSPQSQWRAALGS
jgi:hypothetical protein